MGRESKHDWEKLLKEYLKSNCKNKTEFAKLKGINPSLLRRNTAHWPKKTAPKKAAKKVTKKSNKKAENSQSKTLLKKPEKNEVEILTEKQKLFCYYFVENNNAAQAAIKAGYSKETARMIGYENLTKPYIREEVERLKEIKRQSIMLSEDDIVEKQMRIAFVTLGDFLDFGTKEEPARDRKGNIIIDAEGIVKTVKYSYMDLKNSDMVDSSLISEMKQGKYGISFKLLDSQKALEWLADYFNMNPMSKHKKLYDDAKLALEREAFEHRKEMDAKNNW